jgi:glycosyltransferase involved in cell wall biosynthesis
VAPSVVYVLPTSELYGGIRVILEHAEGLLDRGYDVRVVGPDPVPDWHPLRAPYTQVALFEPGGIPAADICVGTFWTTVGPAFTSGSRHVFHLCQGYEGVHREYAAILPQIDAAYRLPIPKLLISAHLEPVLVERYGCRCHFLGQAVDSTLFTPGAFRAEPSPLRVGIVGPFGVRSKGIGEALAGLRLARERGFALEVHRASADPLEDAERSLGVTDRFFHRLDTQGMVGFYQELDAYVHPSHDEEGYPLPPLEAMASGVPVALSRIRPFAVVPEVAVVRFPPGEPEALVPAVAALCDPERRRAMREAGLAYARVMTLDKVLDRLEAAFASAGVPVVNTP